MKQDIIESNDSSDFILLTDYIPEVILEMRYFTTYNFVGEYDYSTNLLIQSLRVYDDSNDYPYDPEISDEVFEQQIQALLYIHILPG